MRILVIIDYYLPGYRGGGSIRTVANLIDALGDEFEFIVMTRDRDWRSPQPYERVPTGEWVRVGKARVRYLASRDWSFRRLARLIRSVPHDVLYLNSLFSPLATIRSLLLRRVGALPDTLLIVGPRGELACGALGTRTMKKRAWLTFAKAFGLFRGVVWQASTPAESDDIRREIGPSAHIVEAIDCTPRYDDWPGNAPREAKVPGCARFCLVSRIAPVKNVEFALRLLHGTAGDIDFDLYGPIDDAEYWSRCEAVIATLPANVRVANRGSVPHAELGPILARYDLLLLPTLGENFGHTILEALAAGCPVLVSDRTPWRQLQSAGVGWDLPLEDAAAFRRAIGEIVSMPESAHAEMRRRAREFALRAADPAPAIEQNRSMFLGAVQRRSA